jgi:glucose dehydrogenase
MDSRTQPDSSDREPPNSAINDPILMKRALISNWAKRAANLGYSLFALSMVAVIWGVVIDFSPTTSRVATISLIGGCLVLAPAILVQYSVKAAVRDERENAK